MHPTHNTQPPEPKDNPSGFSLAPGLWQRWQPWIIGPLLIGLAGVALAIGCDYASYLNLRLQEAHPQAAIIVLPFGFALIVYLTRRFFRGAQGCGIPQTIAAIADEKPEKKSFLLSIRISIGKALMLLGGLSLGASLGRDGPAVQIGASLMHAFYGRNTEKSAEENAKRRRMLVTAGSAAGIAVAFSAPLAGMLFALEMLSPKHALKARSPLFVAVLVAMLISLALLGHSAYFGSTPAYLDGFAQAPGVVICGILGGIAGGLFSRLMIKMAFEPPRMLAGMIWNRPMLFAGFCGIGVALCGLLTDNLAFGAGYEATRATLQGSSSAYAWYYGPAKFLATFFSGISGIPGGVLAPSLSVGAGLGDGLSGLLPTLGPHAAIVLLMMAAYLAGVIRAPLTALAVIIETTSSLHLLLPLAAAILIAHGVSKLISPQALYQTLSDRFTS